MMEKCAINIFHLVPKNEKGSENDVCAVKNCQSLEIAEKTFEKLAQKLLEVNDWDVTAGKNLAKFYLVSGETRKSSLVAKENDFVKIKMPAPKNKLGQGYDWVIINKIRRSADSEIKYLLVQMKPHSCPENASGSVAHFYAGKATNSFIMAQYGTKIQFSIHGRNEIPNTENMSLINKLRNMFVAIGGIFGGSKLQWKVFAESFIK